MVNGKHDSREVSILTKEHFEKLGNVFVFRIESINFNETTKKWTIVCSFLDSLLADKRVTYQIEFDDEESKFLNAKRLSET